MVKRLSFILFCLFISGALWAQSTPALSSIDFSDATISQSGPESFYVRNVVLPDQTVSLTIGMNSEGSWEITEVVTESENIIPKEVVLDFATVEVTDDSNLEIDWIIYKGSILSGVLGFSGDDVTVSTMFSARGSVDTASDYPEALSDLLAGNETAISADDLATLREDYEAKIDAITTERDEYETKADTASSEKDTLASQIDTLKTDNASLKALKDKLEADNTSLQEMIDTLKSSETAAAETSTSDETLSASESVVKSYIDKLDTLQAEIENLHTIVSGLEDQLESEMLAAAATVSKSLSEDFDWAVATLSSAISEEIEEAASSLSTSSSVSGDGVTIDVESAAAAIAAALSDDLDIAAETISESLTDDFNDAVTAIYASLSDDFKAAASSISESLSDDIDAATSSLSASLKEELDAAATKLAELFSSDLDAAKKAIIESISSAPVSPSSAVSSTADSTGSLVTSLQAQIEALTNKNSELTRKLTSLDEEIRASLMKNGFIELMRPTLTRTLVSSFEPSEAQLGLWHVGDRSAKQLEKSMLFGKLLLPVTQDEKPVLYSFKARSTDPANEWVGLGLHIFVDNVEKRGYGLGDSLLVWLTRDQEVYKNDYTYLQLYRSDDDVHMDRVMDAVIQEPITEFLKIEVLYQPVLQYITISVDGEEKLRYKTWFGIEDGVQVALRSLGTAEFADLRVTTTP